MNRFVLLQKNYGERKLAVHRFHFEDAYEQNRSLENYISMDRSNAYRPRDDEHGYAGKLLKRVDIERRFADGSQALVRLPSRDDEQPSSFREAERLEAGRAQAFCERRDGGGSPYPLTPFEEEAQRKPNDQEILRRAEQVVTRQRAEDRAQAPQIRAPAGECLQATGRRVRGRSPAPDQRGDEGSGWGRGKPATPYSATVLNQNKKGGESRLIFFSTLRNPLPLLRPWYSPSNGGLMAGGFFNRISGRIFKRAATDSKDEASMVTASQQAHEHQPASASAPMPTDDEIKSVLERLIGPGVKANFKHANGDEPLHYAAFKGDLEASRLLIAAGADVNARGQQGMTPLHMSIYGRNPDVSDLLLASGSNPALKDNNGQVAGYMDRALYDESRKNREEGFKARVGVDPSDPIFHAENLQQLKQALAEGASVRDTDVLGRNPLHYAQNGEMVRALSHAGADFSAVDNEGNTPFHTAADDAIHELYQKNSWVLSPKTANNQGQVPYDYRDAFEAYRDHDAYEEEEARLESISAGERSAEERSYVLNIVALVEAGDAAKLLEQVEPNEVLVSGNRRFDIDGDQGWSYNDYAGYSVLHEAAKQGNAELCRELVFAGADWNKECRDVSEQGFDNYVNGFRNEPGMKPIDFASNSETRSFLDNAENELRAHNRAKLLESVLPPANAWKPPEGGFGAEARRQIDAAMKAQGGEGEVQQPRIRQRF